MGNSPKGEYMLKKRNITNFLGIGVMSLFLLGCSKNGFLLQELDESGQDEIQVTDTVQANQVQIVETTIEEVAIHICGAVKNPGVFFLEKGQRVYHAIEMAGGLREDADGDYINQALLLEDGMKIVIPTKEETKQWKEQEEKEQEVEAKLYEEKGTEDYYVQYADSASSTIANEKVGKVNLNTADENLLCTLPGIGTSRAKSIIDYRTKNGAFKTIEDVMKVSGIKEAAFEKIKDLITVSN